MGFPYNPKIMSLNTIPGQPQQSLNLIKFLVSYAVLLLVCKNPLRCWSWTALATSACAEVPGPRQVGAMAAVPSRAVVLVPGCRALVWI